MNAKDTNGVKKPDLLSHMRSRLALGLKRLQEGVPAGSIEGEASAPPPVDIAPSRAAIEDPESYALHGWRMMVDAMPDAAVVLGSGSQVLHANAPFDELYPGVRVGQPLSRSLRQPELIEAIDRCGASAVPEVVMLHERLPVERRISARVVRLAQAEEADGDTPFLLVTFRDLSEQDKLAQMREDFIANASHELRTPLTSLKGFIETLQGPARDDATARVRFLKLMAGQAERMTRLIDDLLSLSRVEMGAHVPPRGIVDLNEVAAYVLQTLEPVAAAAGARMVLQAADVPARLRGDRDQIVQVMSNLVQNAITYGGPKQIDIVVSMVAPGPGKPAQVMAAVTDRGPGIAAHHLPRLTERFYRANVASSRAKGGTGLGLAIVKHIVARHRGEFDIQSQVGQGSTFRVRFDLLSKES